MAKVAKDEKHELQIVAREAVQEFLRVKKHQHGLREQLRTVLGKQEGEELYRRAVEEMDDPFEGLYDTYRLKEPPYPFQNLYTIVEESDVLQACIEAMQNNVDGFGYQMSFLGDDLKEKETPLAQAQLAKAEDFFDRINEKESFMTIRRLMRQDVEILGNGGFEVIRNIANEPAMMYYLPFRHIRMSASLGQPVTVDVPMPREGKIVNIKVKKYFRKFAQLRYDGKKVRWFKEYGDPRPMDFLTGEYGPVKGKVKNPASEIMFFKLHFGGMHYGLPRWIGTVLSVLGRRLAEFVNYDLFENQGIPPMAVMISGGTLTDESMNDLMALIRGARGVENFSRVLVLEALVEGVGLEDSGNVKMELKNLSEYRKEDQMFSTYMKETEERIRHRYRMPPLYLGKAETFTHATARAAQTVAEEQVFVPERMLFDEPINNQILSDLKIDSWMYKTRGPRVVGASEISSAVNVFNQAGAFTINHAIERANEAFGLEMSKFDAPWANYPVPIVMEMIKNGRIAPKDVIEGMTFTEPPAPAPKALPVSPKNQLKLLPAPKAAAKIDESTEFSGEEKEFLKFALTLHDSMKDAGFQFVGNKDQDPWLQTK